MQLLLQLKWKWRESAGDAEARVTKRPGCYTKYLETYTAELETSERNMYEAEKL